MAKPVAKKVLSPSDTRYFHFRVPEDLHQDIRFLAFHRSTSRQEIVFLAVSSWVAKEKAKELRRQQVLRRRELAEATA